MKHLRFLIALFAVTALITYCNPKEDKPDTKPDPVTQTGKKATVEVFSSTELQFMDEKMNTVADPAARGKRKTVAPNVTVAAAVPTLTHGSGNSFTINYNGATDVVWVFNRCGNELNPTSGNVIPLTAGPSFYLNPVTTFNSWCSGLYYQVVVVTGSTTPDANGVVGADWVMTYSNVED